MIIPGCIFCVLHVYFHYKWFRFLPKTGRWIFHFIKLVTGRAALPSATPVFVFLLLSFAIVGSQNNIAFIWIARGSTGFLRWFGSFFDLPILSLSVSSSIKITGLSFCKANLRNVFSIFLLRVFLSSSIRKVLVLIWGLRMSVVIVPGYLGCWNGLWGVPTSMSMSSVRKVPRIFFLVRWKIMPRLAMWASRRVSVFILLLACRSFWCVSVFSVIVILRIPVVT